MAELAVGQIIRLNDGRNGTIRFVGQTSFAAGEWVGVELEDDSGKNDGSVQGERYFDCMMGHGMFVRPVTVTVLAQPPPPKPAAQARKTGRPSSLFNTASGRGSADPTLGKRMSLNAPSPTPGAKTSRPSSIARSPTKSPTKMMHTAVSSASTSRTATPNAARVTSLGARSRPSTGPSTTRTSMGPPPIPAPGSSRPLRQPSTSSSATTRAGGRTLGGRLTLAGPRGPARPDSGRNTSGGSQSGNESGPATRSGDKGSMSSQKSDSDILSPQPTSPVQVKTAALEKLAGTTPTTSKPPPTAPSAPRPVANNTAQTRRIEDLEAKIRVLERKRLEDRDKIKQLDKVQAERDKFESIIQKLQVKYQPQQQEIADLRRQLKEAETRLESIEGMVAEHESAMELATLDREMAEETVEFLKEEVEVLKQKSEELELEVEILREENAEFTKGMSPEERSSTGWLQMARTNERYKEALLRLRDLARGQEEELKAQIKGLEEDLEEFGQVKVQYEMSKEKLSQAEATVEDLRQQLDNALGAEDMIEDLTERNMGQAEQIEELKAVVEDLENLKEINDELEINHVQNEKEMQEDLDFKDSVITEQARRAAQQEEALEDMEYTLSRFRELVTSLQSDLEDMRASHAVTETESEQLNSRSRAMMDLNMKLQISAAKAQVKTIDLELRRLEAQEAEQHLEIVKLFLPETYQIDRDSVLALLRFKRLAFKANLLHSFIKERVNGQPQPGHEDDVFAGCDAIDKLTWVSAMCDRFVNAISHCSLDQFAKYEGALYELEPVERALNVWIDGLRRDELKPKQCASELQRTIALMSHLAEVHISNDLESCADDIHMRALLVQSHLDSAAAAFTAVRSMVQRVIPPSGDDDELAQYFLRKAEAVISQTRSSKVIAGKTVRALEDLRARSLSLMPDTVDAFEQCETASQMLAELARQIGLDLHQLLTEEGRTEPYTYLEVQGSAHKTAMRAVGSSESDLFAAYASRLRTLTTQIADLAALSADLSQTQEFERSERPWVLRSQELRAAKTVPVDAEEETRRLREEYAEARRAVAQRDESLSTAQLKIDTLESRMRDAGAKAARITDLEGRVDEEARRAAALRDDVEKQDRELKALEADRDRWKKVASESRLVGVRPGAGALDGGVGAAVGHEHAVATAREMDALRSEITGLQSAVRYLREDSRRARLAEQPAHDWLAEPLTKAVPPAERHRSLLIAEGKDVLSELLRLATSPSVKPYDLAALPADKLAWRPAKSTPQYHAAKQMEDYTTWRGWQDAVLRKAQQAVTGQRGAVSKDGGRSETNRAHGVRRNAAARLQIRLPDSDGKVIHGTEGGRVQIVGSREWENMQGRLVGAL